MSDSLYEKLMSNDKQKAPYPIIQSRTSNTINFRILNNPLDFQNDETMYTFNSPPNENQTLHVNNYCIDLDNCLGRGRVATRYHSEVESDEERLKRDRQMKAIVGLFDYCYKQMIDRLEFMDQGVKKISVLLEKHLAERDRLVRENGNELNKLFIAEAENKVPKNTNSKKPNRIKTSQNITKADENARLGQNLSSLNDLNEKITKALGPLRNKMNCNQLLEAKKLNTELAHLEALLKEYSNLNKLSVPSTHINLFNDLSMVATEALLLVDFIKSYKEMHTNKQNTLDSSKALVEIQPEKPETPTKVAKKATKKEAGSPRSMRPASCRAAFFAQLGISEPITSVMFPIKKGKSRQEEIERQAIIADGLITFDR